MSAQPDAKPDAKSSDATDLVLTQLRAEMKELRLQFGELVRHLHHTTFRARLRRLIVNILDARLSKLTHYPPRPLRLPAKYSRTTPPADPPAFSIVTPSYNQGRFLEETIRSVLDQNYPRLEYVIQDGGSKDESGTVIDKYRDRLAHAESRKDDGQAHAINLGFAHATGGEIMAYLNSDDLLLPGTLNYVADYFARHPDVDLVYGHRIIIDTDGREVGRWVLPGHSDHMLVWADYVPQETMFWRRRIWDKVGGKIDESFKFALDWDLLLRFREAGAKFVRLPRFLGAFRVHPTQKTSAELAENGTPEMNRIRLRLHGRETPFEEIRKNLRGYMLRHVWHHWLYRLGIAHQ